MRRWAVLLALILVVAPIAARSEVPPPRVIVAVMDVEFLGLNQSQEVRDRLTVWLTGRLGATGRFQVVPREQVKMRLVELKRDSYAADCDLSCQIELGQVLAAQKTITTQVVKAGSRCTVTLNVFDLARETSEGGASVDGGCDEDGIVESLLVGVQRLVGGGTGPGQAVAPPPTWDEKTTTAVVPDLPAVAEERGVLRVEGTPRNARVDVAGPSDFGTDGKLATALPYGPATVLAGEYRVQVSAPDHDADTRTVTVYADRTALVEVALVLSNGVLEPWGTPAGAKVELTCAKGFSRTFGLPGKATSIPVPRGTCRVRVSRNGYQPFERQVDVVGGRTVRVDVNLVQIPDTPPARAPSVPSGAAAAEAWRDPTTGLTWQNPGPDKSMNWRSAKSYCASLSLAGGGWRLPTISELRSLIQGCAATQTGGRCKVMDSCRSWECRSSSCDGCTRKGGPANGCYWPDEMEGNSAWYWSSSPVTDNVGSAFRVHFGNGRVYYDYTDNVYYVRCVR